ncbi:hypothetical protein B566_EDAN017280 [Ephemera danica]|nr:hypothetical protein B566_EDAN017280 [Ephemera danica]
MRSVAVSFLRGRSTVCEVIRETCSVLAERLQPIYMKIPTYAEWMKIKEDFFELWDLPNCLGAIDGKHIAIKKPFKTGSEYRNYKYGFSTVLLALADANYMFRIVDIGQYGSASDGGIFSRSPFGQWWNSGKFDLPETGILPGTEVEMPTFLAADAAFPLKINILKPYGTSKRNESLTESQRIFNYRLSRRRRVVENAFGILVSRFRVFEKPIQADVKTVDYIVQAAVLLHNFLRIKTDPRKLSPTLFDRYGPNGELIEGDWRRQKTPTGLLPPPPLGDTRERNVALEFRADMTRYFMSVEGHIADQDREMNEY